MPGLKIVLPGVFTNSALPKLQADSLLNDGSLFLIDFGREETSPRTSVPANNATLLNLAWDNAAAVIGGGTEATLAGIFENTLVGVPAMGAVSRTAKYGINVIASQVAMDGANRHGGIRIPDLVKNYVRANLPGRSFYVSIWGRTTRVASAGIQSIGYIGDAGAATSYAWNFQNQPTFGPGSGSAFVGSLAEPNSNAVGNFFRAGAVDEWTSTKPAEGSTIGAFWIGSRGIYTSFSNNTAMSGIIYRVYIEDLTAGGRGYAATLAADKALYDAAFAPGGRFASDTFTAASTIP